MLAQGQKDLALYKAQLGDITYGQLQGAKLTFPSSMRPSTQCCLMSAQLHLERARAGELLLDSAEVELLQFDRMSQFDARNRVLAWLEAAMVPAPRMPADAPHCGDVACTSATSTAASERSGSRRSSVSSARSKEVSCGDFSAD